MTDEPPRPDGGFGLYVHWPFCQAKCPYCDFNSHVAGAVDQSRWARAYEAEIARLAAETGRRPLTSIYFGGGTPSLMDPDTVERIIAAARAGWGVANDVEITLEANPTSVEAARFQGYRAAGVERVSIGIQALRDGDLRALGRRHNVREALDAYDLARKVFSRVSFDLIYARQGQSVDAWREELGKALALAPDHLSLYQLTIEPGTAFGARHAAGGLRGLPDEDLGADLWDVTQDMTKAAGLPAYEISNHARAGEESRHNLIYWTGGDYAGVGPGAHGRLTDKGNRLATETALAPSDWITRVETTGTGETRREALTRDDLFAEALMMGLRLRHGVALSRLETCVDPDFAVRLGEVEQLGLVERSGGRLLATTSGRPVLNGVLRALLP